MGNYTEAWRTVHNLVAQFAALTDLESVLKRAADAEAFIAQHAANVDEAQRLQASIESMRAELAKIPDEINAKRGELLARLDGEIARARSDERVRQGRVQDEHEQVGRQYAQTLEALVREIRDKQADAQRVREQVASARGELATAQADLASLKTKIGRV